MFKYSSDNKRYHTLNYYNNEKYGAKVYKAVIDAGFTCPNIDGTKGSGGCIFCDNGSGYFINCGLSVEEQLKREINRIKSKDKNGKIIAYLQPHTNTYTNAKNLNSIIDKILKDKEICGIAIGTRADCLSINMLKYLEKLTLKTNLTVELGLQTIHDKTAKKINRCHTYKEFLNSYYDLKNRGIRICLHLINNLPYETFDMMLETAYETGQLEPDAVKLQMLHIIIKTKIHEMYLHGKIKLMEKEQYVDLIIRQLELFPEKTVIERITGDGDKKKLAAPLWSADKLSVLGSIDKKMAELNTYQGKYFVNRL